MPTRPGARAFAAMPATNSTGQKFPYQACHYVTPVRSARFRRWQGVAAGRARSRGIDVRGPTRSMAQQPRRRARRHTDHACTRLPSTSRQHPEDVTISGRRHMLLLYNGLPPTTCPTRRAAFSQLYSRCLYGRLYRTI